jgi:hypothetical protein
MEFLLGAVCGVVGVIGGIYLYDEMVYRRNRKKIWREG